jgi:SAM-dependent methyltransferase
MKGATALDIARVQRKWNEFGELDPMWAVLNEPDKLGNRWDPKEFYATGVRDVSALLNQASAAGLTPRFGRALDFGCGVGRLTQALAHRFAEVHGVDIAPSMLEQARKVNGHGDNCVFHLNSSADLRLFPDAHFEFICSLITLQHIEPRYSAAYLIEMVRVLKPGGVLVFQLPTKMTTKYQVQRLIKGVLPSRLLYAYRMVRFGKKRAAQSAQFAGIEMYGTARRDVECLLRRAGGTVATVIRDQHAGKWISYRYFVAK